MNIIPSGPKGLNAYQNQMENNKAAKPKQQVAKQDRAEISPQAREIMTCRTKLKEMPEVREKLVEKLKAEINNGTYQADPQKIAAGLLKDAKWD